MGILNTQIKNKLKSVLDNLPNDVILKVFTQEIECPTCRENTSLMQEIAEVSDKIKLEVLNFIINKEEAEKLKIDKIPATAVVGEKDYGIRFYGVPAGYEFNSFISALKLVGTKNSGLKTSTIEQLKGITKLVNIKVFVTLTCPYCPMAVELAHKFAFESDYITSEMINAQEFPHLANKYGVYAVPKVVINEKVSFEGAVPEDIFLTYITEATK
ncbi:MAG: thioredoxin family protein [Endomicrobia bacterium]|nr:thioredoxin family protein [Endomicrobiia bacterium]